MSKERNDNSNPVDADGEYRARADRERSARIDEFIKLLSAGSVVDHPDTSKASDNDEPNSHSDALDIRWNVLRFLLDEGKSNIPDISSEEVDNHEGHRERLRQAVKRDRELNVFGDDDIIEILLSYLIPRKDTNPIAKTMLKDFGSVDAILRASPDELTAFKGMTRSAAELIPTLSTAIVPDIGEKISIAGHRDAVEFLSTRFLGGDGGGTLALFLDKDFMLLGVEKLRGPQLIPINAVLGSAYKYCARYVIIGRRVDEIISTKFALVNDIERATDALGRCGVKLLDCLLFTDYGYYMLGSTKVGSMTLEMSAVPLYAMSRSPELIRRVERIVRRESVDSDAHEYVDGEYADTFSSDNDKHK